NTVACSIPASTGSLLAAIWAASRIRVQTGSTDRGSAAFLTSALSIRRSPSTRPGFLVPERIRRSASRPHSSTTALQDKGSSTLVPGFQFVDQRLDLAAVVLNVGSEVRTSSHDHAHAFDLDVGDAQALGGVAHLPFELHGLAVALAE